MYVKSIVTSSLIITFFIIYIARVLFDKPINFKDRKTLISLIILIILVPIAYYIFDNFIRVFINCIILSLTYKFIFKEKILKSLFVSFLTMTYFFIAEIIFSIILVIFLSINAIELEQNWTGTIFANIYISLLAFLIVNITPLTNFLIKIVKKYERTKYSEAIIIMIFAIGILSNKNVLFLGINLEYIMNLFLVIIFGVIVFYFIKEKEYSFQLSLKYDQLFKYVCKYEKELTNKNMTIHEFKNQLIAIKGFIDEKDKNIDKYLDSLINDFKKIESKVLKNMEHIPSGGLKGLIYFKLGDLEEEKIKVCTNISPTIKKNIFDNMDPELYKDIIKIIGVYLDNAIEAARISEKKKIILEMFLHDKEFNFIFSNTYDGKIDINRLSEIGYSTKGKGKGYGLALADKIINKYDFIQQKREVINNLYIVYLTINLKNILVKK